MNRFATFATAINEQDKSLSDATGRGHRIFVRLAGCRVIVIVVVVVVATPQAEEASKADKTEQAPPALVAVIIVLAIAS